MPMPLVGGSRIGVVPVAGAWAQPDPAALWLPPSSRYPSHKGEGEPTEGSLRRMPCINPVGHQPLQAPQVAVADAEAFEDGDGGEQVFGHRAAEAAGGGEDIGEF